MTWHPGQTTEPLKLYAQKHKKMWLGTCEHVQMKTVSVQMWGEYKYKFDGGRFSWFAPMMQFSNTMHYTFWWGVDIMYVGCLMD